MERWKDVRDVCVHVLVKKIIKSLAFCMKKEMNGQEDDKNRESVETDERLVFFFWGSETTTVPHSLPSIGPTSPRK